MDQVNQKALAELAEYRKKGCHLLVPCMEHIDDVAQGFRLIVTPVTLRPHPKDKDVYPHEGGHYNIYKNDWYEETGEGKYKRKIIPADELVRISGQGLEKLAQNVNVIWSQPAIETDRTNKGRQVCYITAALRMPDGFSFYRVPDLYGMDLDIEREKLIAQYIKADTKEEDVPKKKANIDRDFLQKKTNQTKLCISGAKNRCIRKLLGIDNAYTVASMALPFVSVRVIPWLDMTDEYTRKLVIESNVKQMAIASIFGGQPPVTVTEVEKPAIEYVGDIPKEKCLGDDVIDSEPTDPPPTVYRLEPHEEDVPFALGTPPDQTQKTAESLRLDFENCVDLDQAKILLAMVASKKQEAFVASWFKQFPRPVTLETIGPKNRLKLYDHLVALPYAEKGKVTA